MKTKMLLITKKSVKVRWDLYILLPASQATWYCIKNVTIAHICLQFKFLGNSNTTYSWHNTIAVEVTVGHNFT